MSLKNILSKIINYFSCIKYEIGFARVDDDFLLSSKFPNISWLKCPMIKDSWFADPFLLSVDKDRIQVLAEEFFYDEEKGRISLLEIENHNNEYILQKVTPVLSLSTHLSFPYIIHDNNVVYVCPENNQSGCVYLYQYDSINKRLINPLLIINEPLVDVQIVKHNDKFYAFGVLFIAGEMNETKKVRVYSSNSLHEQFSYFKTMLYTKPEGRGAGEIWVEDDYYVRPVQCCDGGYGKGLIFNKLSFNGGITETEINRYYANGFNRNGLSLHTFNKIGPLCVVDGHDYKNVKIISRIIVPIINYFYTIYKQKLN